VVAPFLAELDAFAAAVKRAKSVNVNDQSTKDRAIALAGRYFEECRPSIVAAIGENELVGALDSGWQDLVRLAHGNNARKSYTSKLRVLREKLRDANVSLVAAPPASRSVGTLFSSEEQLILGTIENLVPSASASYRQGLLDLRGPDRVSYRGTAVEFREALREVLDHLAPDDQVTRQDGFKLEPGRTRPTMKQQVRFILRARGLGKSQREASEKSVGLIDERIGEIARAIYERASVATHVVETKAEVAQIKRFVDTVLFDILEIAS
jgi:hypothetical protein